MMRVKFGFTRDNPFCNGVNMSLAIEFRLGHAVDVRLHLDISEFSSLYL